MTIEFLNSNLMHIYSNLKDALPHFDKLIEKSNFVEKRIYNYEGKESLSNL